MGNEPGLDTVDEGFAAKFNLKPRHNQAATTERQQEPSLAGTGLAGEEGGPLPSPGDPYQAASRACNKEQLTLRILLGDGSWRGLSYSNLDTIDLVEPEGPGNGPDIVLLYLGAIAREVVISGRQLTPIYDLLCDHRLRWLREIPQGRDFEGREQTVITRVSIRRPQLRL